LQGQDQSYFLELLNVVAAQGEHAASAVPLLLKIHEKAGSYNQIEIIVALGKIGPAASDALPMLSKSLQSQNADVRRAAAEAIQAITKKK
jgi:HEAT repeat protein